MPAGQHVDLEQVAERGLVRVQQVVVGEVRALAEDEQRRDPHPLERGRLRGHLPVGGDDRRLAVAVAVEPVVVEHEVDGELLHHQLARRPVELALLEAAVDALVEGHVGALLARVLGRVEGDVRRDEDRRVEQDEPRDELGRPCGQLEGEASAEGVAHERAGLVAHRLGERGEMGVDAPRRLVRRRAVAEQVGSEDAEAGKRFGELGEVTPVARDAVQAHDSRGARLSPLVDVQAQTVSWSVSSDSGTISVRRSSLSFTSDQMMVPSLSIRKVPRWGAPFSSLNTP